MIPSLHEGRCLSAAGLFIITTIKKHTITSKSGTIKSTKVIRRKKNGPLEILSHLGNDSQRRSREVVLGGESWVLVVGGSDGSGDPGGWDP